MKLLAVLGLLTCVHITSVHDGDTFYINLPDLPPVFGTHLPVRVAHIDAPEIKGLGPCEKEKAEAAKAFVVAWGSSQACKS